MNEAVPERAIDAVQAFDDLRAEVSILRRAVEALPAAIAQNKPPDYAADLGILGQGLDAITNQLDAIQKLPALAMTPAEQGRSIAHAGSAMLREATQKLDYAASAADRERDNLRVLIGVARTKEEQKRRLLRALVVGVVVGLFLFPITARMLPFGLNQYVASWIVDTNR